MLNFIFAQLGPIVAVIVALVAGMQAWLLAGKRRQLQIELETLRAKNAVDFAARNDAVASQVELLRANLRRQDMVGGKQTAKEFEAYEIIWEHIENVYQHARTIATYNELDLGDTTKIIRDRAAKEMSEPWSEFERILRKYAPFIHEDAYDALEHFRKVFLGIWSADQIFESLFDKRPTSKDLDFARQGAMEAIRARLGLSIGAESSLGE